MSASPSEVLDAITASCRQLDTLSREQARAIRQQVAATLAYDEAMEAAKLMVLHEHKERGERLPAEDLRTAMAHRRIDSRLYGEYLTARAEVEALKAQARATEASLSGRQSLLSVLKAELVGGMP